MSHSNGFKSSTRSSVMTIVHDSRSFYSPTHPQSALYRTIHICYVSVLSHCNSSLICVSNLQTHFNFVLHKFWCATALYRVCACWLILMSCSTNIIKLHMSLDFQVKLLAPMFSKTVSDEQSVDSTRVQDECPLSEHKPCSYIMRNVTVAFDVWQAHVWAECPVCVSAVWQICHDTRYWGWKSAHVWVGLITLAHPPTELNHMLCSHIHYL